MTGDREYQRYLVMAVNAERAARGWTIKGLAERAGINERTMLRIVHLERDMDMGQAQQLAEALGIRLSALMQEAERRANGGELSNTPDPGDAIPSDLRERILFLLANPNRDERLSTLLGEVAGQTGLSAKSMKHLQSEIRSIRQEELRGALQALPSDHEGNNHHTG